MYKLKLNKKPNHIWLQQMLYSKAIFALSYVQQGQYQTHFLSGTLVCVHSHIHRHKCSISDAQITLLCPRKLEEYPPEP